MSLEFRDASLLGAPRGDELHDDHGVATSDGCKETLRRPVVRAERSGVRWGGGTTSEEGDDAFSNGACQRLTSGDRRRHLRLEDQREKSENDGGEEKHGGRASRSADMSRAARHRRSQEARTDPLTSSSNSILEGRRREGEKVEQEREGR